MDYLDELIEEHKKSDPEFAHAWAAGDLVDQLARRRIEQGLSQQEIAERMGIARARISEIENHPERVSFARILGYANALGAHFLIEGTEPVSRLSPRKGRPVSARSIASQL